MRAGSQQLTWESGTSKQSGKEAGRGGRWKGVTAGQKLPPDSCGVIKNVAANSVGTGVSSI